MWQKNDLRSVTPDRQRTASNFAHGRRDQDSGCFGEVLQKSTVGDRYRVCSLGVKVESCNGAAIRAAHIEHITRERSNAVVREGRVRHSKRPNLAGVDGAAINIRRSL